MTAETLTEQELPHTSRCVAAGRCRGSWRSQGYPGMCQQKSSRNKGLPHTCRPNWSGIGLETFVAEINLEAAKPGLGAQRKPVNWCQNRSECVWERRSQGSDRYVPAKTLTEQGCRHMSKLLDVVKTLTHEGPGISGM